MKDIHKILLKGVVAWPAAWCLYWTGHFVSRELLPLCGYRMYKVYNRLMCMSFDVQKWGNLNSPWKDS